MLDVRITRARRSYNSSYINRMHVRIKWVSHKMICSWTSKQHCLEDSVHILTHADLHNTTFASGVTGRQDEILTNMQTWLIGNFPVRTRLCDLQLSITQIIEHIDNNQQWLLTQILNLFCLQHLSTVYMISTRWTVSIQQWFTPSGIRNLLRTSNVRKK